MALQPLPTLKSRSFSSYIATQFLGAFNDNIFKQMLLLLAVAAWSSSDGPAKDYQGVVTAIFTIPFLLFSGYAGQLSEIYPKTTIMRLSKIGELFIMIGGAVGFYYNNTTLLLVFLFFMGSQSAFFGPAKYGVIPEMVKSDRLVAANGVVQMTTILSIILGVALGGILTKNLKGQLHMAGFFCIVIAIIGVVVVHIIPKSKANKPEMTFNWNPIGRLWLSFKDIFADRPLLLALVAYSYFFFSGAIVMKAVNNYGMMVLGLDEQETSFMLVFMSFGIIFGSLCAAPAQRTFGGKWTIFTGALGVCIFEFLMIFHHLPMGVLKFFLFMAGSFSALYFVPIAAFMQDRPALGKKGEILAAVNFSNFSGIMLSAVVWQGLMSMGYSAVAAWLLLSIGLAILLAIMFPQLKKIE